MLRFGIIVAQAPVTVTEGLATDRNAAFLAPFEH